MTAQKNLKRLIRARMRQTGESYTAARRFFLHHEEIRTMSNITFRNVNNSAYGFSVDVPTSWIEAEPDLNNSPFEVACFRKRTDDPLEGGVGIFRVPKSSPLSAARGNRESLEGNGFGNFVEEELTMGNRPAVRLDFDKPVDKTRHARSSVRHHFVRQYFVAVGDAVMVLAVNSPEPERDRELLDHIASSFDAIEAGAPVIFMRDAETPAAFVTELLEQTFGYTRRRAWRAVVNLDTHGESVVALVDKDRAGAIVDSIQSRAEAAGYPFKCRIGAV